MYMYLYVYINHFLWNTYIKMQTVCKILRLRQGKHLHCCCLVDRVRTPVAVTEDYLTSLDLVTPPRDALHYSGRQLQVTVKALQVKVDRDDPVEEFKVSKHRP